MPRHAAPEAPRRRRRAGRRAQASRSRRHAILDSNAPGERNMRRQRQPMLQEVRNTASGAVTESAKTQSPKGDATLFSTVRAS